jgi:hypothetical protein
MKWKLIDKSKTAAPALGTYKDWKELLAAEGHNQCVYCCISESGFGGRRNFHVEHYRPKSIYPKLTNRIENLFFACGICNVFKSDDWPSEPIDGDLTFPHYPDPSRTDWSVFLENENGTGVVSSAHLTGRYLIERLYLNRPQMITHRRLYHVIQEVRVLIAGFAALDDVSVISKDQLLRMNKLLLQLLGLTTSLWNAVPYVAADVGRAKNT